ncbi:unnamed protein product [Lymnaea stagnalis]|uniref:Netrin receptor UNC5 n=1 Tax=Lymnaea stagnalis TaxID=6523 RepID=A0AAV2GX26_LYMST
MLTLLLFLTDTEVETERSTVNMSKISWLTSHCLLLISLLLSLKASDVTERSLLLSGFVVNVSKGYNENIRTLIVSCKDHYYKNRDGKCEPCRLCVPPEATLLYCSSNRDTICRQLKLKWTKSENFLGILNKIQVEKFPNWKPDTTQIKSPQIYFKMLAKKRRKRQNNGHNDHFNVRRKNETKSFESTTVTATRYRANFENGIELPDTGKESTGTSSWVYITIGVGLVVMLVVIFMATMLYRRRKRSQRNSDRAETVSPPESYIACPTTVQTANERISECNMHNTYEENRRGRSFKDYHDSGDVYELKSLTSDRPRVERSRNIGSMDANAYTYDSWNRSISKSRDSSAEMEKSFRPDLKQFQALPRVKMINSASSTHSSDTTSSFLLSCVGHSEPAEPIRKGHIFRPCSDDKLRGGNVEFDRRYEDVFVNNDLRSKSCKPTLPPRERSTEQMTDRNFQRHPRGVHIGVSKAKGSQECNRNVQKVSSHHSARSYISIPPTIPSENYVEAGTDNLSIHSELSTPPGKMEWLTKSLKFFPKNELGSYQSSLGTQTDSDVAEPKCKTVFGTQWQFGGSFSSSGGIMQAKNSDVALYVPSNAIPRGEFVDIFGAVFIETQEIRKKFEFPAGESLITPLVEYHAEPSANFQRPLCIQLPHSLPDDFETSHIKVYTFTTDDRGRVLSLRCVPFKNKVNDDKNPDGYWEKSSDARTLDITTKHFSGYFCSLCETSSLPSICTMVFGSHVQMNPTRREVRVMLYIWDRRLTIRDYLERFRKLESDVDRQLLTDMQVPLLDSASSESRLVMKMEPMGEDKERTSWRHICRPNSKWPLFKPLQVRKLSEIVHCCRQTDPIRVEWALENVPNQMPSSVFQCCIDIMHAHESTQDYETAMREDSDDLIRTFYIRDLKVTGVEEPPKSQEFHRVDIKRTLSEVMDTEETERLCQEFGITTRDIGNFRKKFSASDILQINLVEECARRQGQENFMQKLPMVLEKLRMTRVLHELEDRKVKLEGIFPPQPKRPSHAATTTQDTTKVKQCTEVVQMGSMTEAKSLYNVSECSGHPSDPSSKNVNKPTACRREQRTKSCQECPDLRVNLNQHELSKVSTISCDGGTKCQCAEKTRTSSSGSDSVLKDSSVQSELQSYPTPTSSLLAERGTDQSCLDSGRSASYTQTMPVNKDLLPGYPKSLVAAELQDDLQISDSGPHAIPHPENGMTHSHGDRPHSSSSNRTVSAPKKSSSKPRLPDLEQTQKKELYAVQTIV